MKKLLLIAFTLFSMNTFAQTPMLKATRLNGLKAENSMKFETSNRVNLKKANSTNKVKAQAAPEGTTKLCRLRRVSNSGRPDAETARKI